MLESAGVYGWIAIAVGAVVLAVALVAAARTRRRVILLQVVTWSLLPILVGYFGTIVQRRRTDERLTVESGIRSTELEARSRGYWASTQVGALASLPALAVGAYGLLRARKGDERPERVGFTAPRR